MSSTIIYSKSSFCGELAVLETERLLNNSLCHTFFLFVAWKLLLGVEPKSVKAPLIS